MIYGYARVSTAEQDLTIQEQALKAAGCEIIRSEKMSGTSVSGRTELRNLLDFARDGDTIIITRIDSDPPPQKWSDLKYVLWHQGGSEHAKEETHA